MAGQDMDRNQDATPHKLREARKRGQIAKSPDCISAAIIAAALIYLSWQGWGDMREQFRFNQTVLTMAGRVDMSVPALWQLLSHGLEQSFSLLAPFFAVIALIAITANLMQTGAVLSSDPLGPAWSKLNPATGFKRLFSMRTLFDAARAVIKLVLLVWVVYYALKSLAPQFFGLGNYSATGYLLALIDDITSMGTKILLMMVLISMMDWLYTRREFAKKMRMSHRDIRDENKNREGDPRIRSRLRELRREMLKRSLAEVKTRQADVLITNPTHLAVALRYEHGEMHAPQLIAKGAGVLAYAMRKVASRHNIPVVRNRALARKLYQGLDIDDCVPPGLYAEVARIVVWVYSMRKEGNAPHDGRAASDRTDGAS